MLYNAQGQAVEATTGSSLLFTPGDNGIHIFSDANRVERLYWPNHEDRLIAPFDFTVVSPTITPTSSPTQGCCPEIAMMFATISGYRLQAILARGATGFAYELTDRECVFRTQKHGLTHPGPGHLARFDLKSTALIMLDSENQSIYWPNMDDKYIIDWADISQPHIQDFIIRMIFAGTAIHPIRLTSADHTYLLEAYDEQQHRS